MTHSGNISHQMEYLLATGNLVSRTGLGLMQVTDYEDFVLCVMKLFHSLLCHHSFECQDVKND